MTPIIVDSTPAGATYLELQDDALSDDFAAAKYRPKVKKWLNEGLHRIYRGTRLGDADQQTAITLSAGTDTYALPSSSIRLDSVYDGNGNDLIEIGIDGLDDAPVQPGQPAAYALVGGDIVFRPVPNSGGSLLVRFRLNPADMVDDDDEPPLHPDYRHLLVTYARSKAFRLEDDPDMANFWWAEWTRDLAELKQDLQRRSRRTRQVPSMWAGAGTRPRFVRP